jgi:hypothetical protein
MEEAEMATAPETELEPGRLTPPPASIARFGAVKMAPVTAVTVPEVTNLRLVKFALLNDVLAATTMLPVTALPSSTVVALRNPA